MQDSAEIAEFRRSPALPLIVGSGAVAGIIGVTQTHPWLFYAGVAVLVIGVANAIWQHRHPLITLSASAMVIRLDFLRRPHRLAYAEVAGWAHSKRWLGFETFRSKRIYLPLQELKKPDRIRLVQHLQALNIGQPAFVGLSERDLERRERRILGVKLALILAVIPASLWFALRAIPPSPDEYHASYPRCAASQLDADLGERCLSAPPAREYLAAAQQQVLDVWRLPPGIASDQTVTLTFRLGPDGTVQCMSLNLDSESALARSILSAVRDATPFDPLSSEVACLLQHPIVASFSNPEAEP
jgi:hypothetical protein